MCRDDSCAHRLGSRILSSSTTVFISLNVTYNPSDRAIFTILAHSTARLAASSRLSDVRMSRLLSAISFLASSTRVPDQNKSTLAKFGAHRANRSRKRKCQSDKFFTGKADNDRHSELKVRCSTDNAFSDDVTPHNSAKDVHQNACNLGATRKRGSISHYA